MMHEPACHDSYKAGNKWRFLDRNLARMANNGGFWAKAPSAHPS
jgi:hypothetical protein